MTGRRKFAFVFVCQQGELEIKSLLLAASLKRFLRCDYELIAAIPSPYEEWGEPSPVTLGLLKQLGVATVPIVNELGREHASANKISCVKIETSADKLIFLDSDILAVKEFHDEPRFDADLNLRIAANQRYTKSLDVWRKTYAAVGLQMPDERYVTSNSEEWTPPYFNSGFVAINRGINLADAWLECARKINAAEGLPKRNPWSDQHSLALAIAKLGLRYDVLDDRYNHPSRNKSIHRSQLPFFSHYHHPALIRKEPLLWSLVHSLLSEHAEIETTIRESELWKSTVLDGYKSLSPPTKSFMSAAVKSAMKLFNVRKGSTECQFSQDSVRDLVITAIPRSGSSLLCRILHTYDNCVVINEPKEARLALDTAKTPWPLAQFYRDVRLKVLDGEPIMNRFAGDELTDDTAVQRRMSEYKPVVRTANFVLGVKQPRPFLYHLDAIRNVMPDARLIACVRDPLDTIASWKNSFPQLREADTKHQLVEDSIDPQFWAEIEKISAIEDPAERRAALWCQLAEIIWRNRNYLTIVHYPDLVLDPMVTIQRALGGWDAGRPLRTIRPSNIRSRSELLDESDLAAIRSRCYNAAGDLGIPLTDLTRVSVLR